MLEPAGWIFAHRPAPIGACYERLRPIDPVQMLTAARRIRGAGRNPMQMLHRRPVSVDGTGPVPTAGAVPAARRHVVRARAAEIALAGVGEDAETP
jgi:hypothetical protein